MLLSTHVLDSSIMHAVPCRFQTRALPLRGRFHCGQFCLQRPCLAILLQGTVPADHAQVNSCRAHASWASAAWAQHTCVCSVLSAHCDGRTQMPGWPAMDTYQNTVRILFQCSRGSSCKSTVTVLPILLLLPGVCQCTPAPGCLLAPFQHCVRT